MSDLQLVASSSLLSAPMQLPWGGCTLRSWVHVWSSMCGSLHNNPRSRGSLQPPVQDYWKPPARQHTARHPGLWGPEPGWPYTRLMGPFVPAPALPHPGHHPAQLILGADICLSSLQTLPWPHRQGWRLSP